MDLKASIFLLLLFLPGPVSASALNPVDWSGVTRALEPKRGQNIEQDLELARAYLWQEKRAEALGVLSAWPRDERARSLVQVAGAVFFNQETADLYYEGLRWIELQRFQDASERLLQAHAREPGNVWVLSRLVQTGIALGRKEQARGHWVEAKGAGPLNRELRLYGVRLWLDGVSAPGEDVKTLLPPKSECLEEEVPAAIYSEVLVRTGRFPELRGLLRQWLKGKPTWSLPLSVGLSASAGVPEELKKKLRAQLEKNLKDRALFDERLDRSIRASRYRWAGFIRYDELVKQVR